MGLLAKVAVVVLLISFVVFVLFFGRIPAFRYGSLYHVRNIGQELILEGTLRLELCIDCYGFIFLVECLPWISG
jgi:hypothetical protein